MQRIPNRLLFILVVCLCRGGVIIFSKIFSNLKTWKFSNFICIVFVKNACFVPYKQEYTIEYTIEPAYVNVGQFSTHLSVWNFWNITHLCISQIESSTSPPPGTPSGHPFRAFEFFLEICVQIPDSLGQKAVHMPHLIYFHANYV